MALNNGPIFFLIDGTPESLARLPETNQLAHALGRPLSILHAPGKAGSPPIDQAIAALPDEPAGVIAVSGANLDQALAELFGTGGILALTPTRRRLVSRLLMSTNYEQMLRRGPVLALPAGAQPAQIKRVLFPIDLAPRSNVAFDAITPLCAALNAELHLLHVYGEDRLLPSERDIARRAATANPRELMQIDQEKIRAIGDRAAAAGVQVRSRTAEGRAHAQILAYTAAHAIDLVVMASHGPRGAEDILLGSTTARVIQKSPVPVLALRA
jgi:nucleotide-binding universal stress UspA family protein